VLPTFFGVASGSIGWYIIPLALGNFAGYLGAAVMVIGGLMEMLLGVDAERKSLEDIAEPLSAESAWQISRART
jgi:hypothetical protein